MVLYFTTDLINASTTSHFENVVTHGAAINMNQFVEKIDLKLLRTVINFGVF